MSIVLFVHQSSEMYGSDKVLLLITQGLRTSGQFLPVVVLPSTGPLHEALLACGVEVHLGEVAKISRAMFSPVGMFRLVWKTFQAVRNLDRVTRGRSIAVVHSNTLAVLSGAVWALLRKKKHLWHVHEIILSPRLVSKVFPYLVNRLSDRVVSNSTLTERWLLSEQPTLAPRSVVVFNGLPLVKKPSEAAIRIFRGSVGAADGDVVVTLAGRINRMKGHALLLDAAAELKRRNLVGSLRFVIVGGPAPGLDELPAQLKAQAVSAGLADLCSFVPFVDDIWPVWFGTDIAVVPSTEPESFGMVAIEAMAAGAPVIAAGHGGVLDILVHEETGLLFAPRDVLALANAIERLVSDGELRKRLGVAGSRRQRELFSVENQVDQTTKVYKEMMG
jgi:glycosyltransferase involved in cell wall biosynthesis